MWLCGGVGYLQPPGLRGEEAGGGEAALDPAAVLPRDLPGEGKEGREVVVLVHDDEEEGDSS